MARDHPDAVSGSSNRYQNWEVVDPEKWVPEGYVCLRVDSRGAGRSPGYLAHNNARETRDIYECIEWREQLWVERQGRHERHLVLRQQPVARAAAQPRTSPRSAPGKAGTTPIARSARHGGIICSFRKNWQDMQVKTVQHGVGSRGKKNPNTGELACGPETLSEHELEQNRENMWREFLLREMTATITASGALTCRSSRCRC